MAASMFKQPSNREFFNILKWHNKTAHENDLAQYLTQDERSAEKQSARESEREKVRDRARENWSLPKNVNNKV